MKEDECQLRQTLTVDEMLELIKKKVASGESLIESTQPDQSSPTQQSTQSQSVHSIQSVCITQSISVESFHHLNGSVQSQSTFSQSIYSASAEAVNNEQESDQSDTVTKFTWIPIFFVKFPNKTIHDWFALWDIVPILSSS